MFISKEELFTVIEPYQLNFISTDERDVTSAILAAVSEATSYLSGKYDCSAIFGATGTKRNILVVEHTKSIALWYLLRKSNVDINADRIKEYYREAVSWFKLCAGVGDGKSITPDLPLKKGANGTVTMPLRMGGRTKFSHDFD